MCPAGLSLVTNMVIKSCVSQETPPSHAEVVAAGRERESAVQHLVTEIAAGLDSV